MGHWWRGRHICFHCDNRAVVEILRANSGSGHIVPHLLRCLYFFSAYFSFEFSAVHIPGISKCAADALSRNSLPLFFSLIPQVPRWVIPPPLLELLVTQLPDWGSQDWIALFLLSLTTGFHSQPDLHTLQANDDI